MTHRDDESQKPPLIDSIQRLDAAWPDTQAHIISLLRARLKSRDEAREAAQEAYIRMRKFIGDEAIRDLDGLALKVAGHVAVDWQRKRTRHLRLNEEFATEHDVHRPDDDRDSPERVYDREQSLELAEHTFQQLPADVRLVCDAVIKGEPAKSIAVRLGIKLHTVYRHIRAAHARITAAFGARKDGERDHE